MDDRAHALEHLFHELGDALRSDTKLEDAPLDRRIGTAERADRGGEPTLEVLLSQRAVDRILRELEEARGLGAQVRDGDVGARDGRELLARTVDVALHRDVFGDGRQVVADPELDARLRNRRVFDSLAHGGLEVFPPELRIEFARLIQEPEVQAHLVDRAILRIQVGEELHAVTDEVQDRDLTPGHVLDDASQELA